MGEREWTSLVWPLIPNMPKGKLVHPGFQSGRAPGCPQSCGQRAGSPSFPYSSFHAHFSKLPPSLFHKYPEASHFPKFASHPTEKPGLPASGCRWGSLASTCFLQLRFGREGPLVSRGTKCMLRARESLARGSKIKRSRQPGDSFSENSFLGFMRSACSSFTFLNLRIFVLYVKNLVKSHEKCESSSHSLI